MDLCSQLGVTRTVAAGIQVAGAAFLVAVVLLLWRAGAPAPGAGGSTRAVTVRRVVLAVWLVACVPLVLGHQCRSRYTCGAHTWDMFHTVLGSKYMDELGHDALYDCALATEHRAFTALGVDRVRDLRTFQRRAAHPEGCRERFTPPRWRAFERDVAFFVGNPTCPVNPRRIVVDYGYNGTPLNATLAGAVFRAVRVDLYTLRHLSVVDDLLIALALVLVFAAFGLRGGLMVVTLLALNLLDRGISLGGSFLRHSYLAFLLAGLSLIRLNRPALAGAALAVATMSRIFPGLFVLAYAIHAAHGSWRRRQLDRTAVVLLAAFAATCAAVVVVTLLWGPGWDVWKGYLVRMLQRERALAVSGIGLKQLFITNRAAFTAGAAALPQVSLLYYPVAIAAAATAARLLLRRLDRQTFSILFGVILMFALTSALGYYYLSLAVLGLLFVHMPRPHAQCWSALALAVFFLAAHTWFVAGNLRQREIILVSSWLLAGYLSCMVVLARRLLGDHELEAGPAASAAIPE